MLVVCFQLFLVFLLQSLLSQLKIGSFLRVNTPSRSQWSFCKLQMRSQLAVLLAPKPWLLEIWKFGRSNPKDPIEIYRTILVGGLEHFFIFHIMGIIIPTDYNIFQRGRYTSNQNMCYLFVGCWCDIDRWCLQDWLLLDVVICCVFRNDLWGYHQCNWAGSETTRLVSWDWSYEALGVWKFIQDSANDLYRMCYVKLTIGLGFDLYPFMVHL